MLQRPEESEYKPYYDRYIQLVPEQQIVPFLQQQQADRQVLLENVTDAQAEYRYEPGKWTLKEVVGHIADTERVMAYRLLSIARGNTTASFTSFDVDAYVAKADFNRLSLEQIADDLSAVRESTCSLIRGISDEAWLRTGTVADFTTTTRALAYIIAGHEVHHMGMIKEKYLAKK